MDVKYTEEILALIARNLAGLSDSNEIAQLQAWIETSENNKKYFEQLRNIWDASDRLMNEHNIDTKEALQKVLSKIQTITPKRTFLYYWQKVAAFILLPLAVGSLLWIYLDSRKTKPFDAAEVNQVNEVHAAFGTRTSLRLADSSLVWLNSGSSIRYPIKFNSKSRQVFLNGEAYFEVKSDLHRPFIVQTASLSVRATGTKFNVKEYDSNLFSEVTLVSGKLFVGGLDNNKNSKLITELNSDQHLAYNRSTKETTISNGGCYKFIAWIEGKLIFRNEPLSKVLDTISTLFNVEFELLGKELMNYRYRATFQDETLEEILKLLKLSAPIDYVEVRRDPLPDGSFPKKKVIVFPAKHLNTK